MVGTAIAHHIKGRNGGFMGVAVGIVVRSSENMTEFVFHSVGAFLKEGVFFNFFCFRP